MFTPLLVTGTVAGFTIGFLTGIAVGFLTGIAIRAPKGTARPKPQPMSRPRPVVDPADEDRAYDWLTRSSEPGPSLRLRHTG